MQEYSKIVADYINGNRNKQLEDNIDFMEMLIEKTNNKEYYDNCSDRLKDDYNFVMYLLKKFAEDTSFISKISFRILKTIKSQEPQDIFEKSIKAANYLAKTDYKQTENNQEQYFSSEEILSIVYSHIRIDFELINSLINNNLNSMGFGYLIDLYGLNTNILNFFALKMSAEILKYHSDDFKEIIHNGFENVEDIEQLHNICIDFTRLYDSSLASYLENNYEILEESFNGIVVDIITNWDNYSSKENSVNLTKKI